MGKLRKSKRGRIDPFEVLVRHWPYIPAHARKTMLDLARSYGPARGEKAFPTPVGADWPDVAIVLVNENEARISVGEITRTVSFAEMGLQEERGARTTKNVGKMLRTYAENPEPGSYFRLPFRKNLKMHIARFRVWLQGYFGIAGDPLESFESAQWLPRFKIRAEYV